MAAPSQDSAEAAKSVLAVPFSCALLDETLPQPSPDTDEEVDDQPVPAEKIATRNGRFHAYWPAPKARIRCAGPGRHTREAAEHDYRRALRRSGGKDAVSDIRALFERIWRRAHLADARWSWLEGRSARIEQWEEQLTTDDNMWLYANSGKIRLRFPGPRLLGAKQHTKDLSGPARGTRETAMMDRDELFMRIRRGDTLQQLQSWLNACRTAPHRGLSLRRSSARTRTRKRQANSRRCLRACFERRARKRRQLELWLRRRPGWS